MFDIGWSEMAVVLLVALVVIGPKDLPRVARAMGKWVAKGRAMAREFHSALADMARGGGARTATGTDTASGRPPSVPPPVPRPGSTPPPSPVATSDAHGRGKGGPV